MDQTELRNGKLIHGDSFEVIKDIPDSSIDMILTDPPYGMDYLLNWKRNRRNKKVSKIENDTSLDWLSDFASECYRVAKDNTAHYCFCSYHNIDIFKEAFQHKIIIENGEEVIKPLFEIKNIITWVKHDTGMGDLYHNFAPKTEFILFFQKGKRRINGNRSPNYLTFHATHNTLGHPTQKPADLIEFLIRKFSDQNDLIFDPFMGSGTTAIAAINSERRWLGIEKEKDYYDLAVKRIQSGKEIKSRLIKDYNF